MHVLAVVSHCGLIYVSLITNYVEYLFKCFIFLFFFFLPSVYLCWWSMCPNLLPFIYLVDCFLIIKFWKVFFFLLPSGYKSFHRYVFCKFFLLCGLSFHSLNDVFCREKVFYFDKIQFINIFLMDHTFGVILKKKTVAKPSVTKICFCAFQASNLVSCFRFRIPFSISFVQSVQYESRVFPFFFVFLSIFFSGIWFNCSSIVCLKTILLP